MHGYHHLCLMKVTHKGSHSLPKASLMKAKNIGATGSLAACMELFGERGAFQVPLAAAAALSQTRG